MTAGTPEWLKSGRGSLPAQPWSFATDAPLTDFDLARERGDVLAADESGGLYRLDRRGRVQSLTRTAHQIRLVGLADDGSSGVAVLDDSTLAWFGPDLQFRWTRTLSDEAIGLSIAPQGTHAVVSLSSGLNVVYDADKRKTCSFESLRPLRYLEFVVNSAAIVVAADYGFFARYSLTGEPEWNVRLWSTVNDLAVTGDGETIALAGLAHGVQIYDADGSTDGAFVLDGTAHRVSSSYQRKRFAVATLERHLLVMDHRGEVKWLVNAPDDVVKLRMSPLGDWVVVGFAGGRLIRLNCLP